MNEEQRKLVGRWSRSGRTAMHAAADLAAQIEERLTHVPGTEDLARSRGFSAGTAQSAERLLGDAGFFRKDETGHYYLPSAKKDELNNENAFRSGQA